ncbi:MAG: O-antigen ligase family protein [Pseudomonadota bacterium]
MGGAVLSPLMAWLAPLGFAALLALMGLLSLPAVRVGKGDRLALGLLAALVGWAAVSTVWSPVRATEPEDNTALKLILQLPLYWAAICGARRADPVLRSRALRILSWGFAAYGAILLFEAFTGAAAYSAVRAAIGDPVEFPYARKNLAQGIFALALLWPVVAAAGARAGAPAWLTLPMAVGVAIPAHLFLADAPVLAVGLALAVATLVGIWPTAAPKALGLFAAALVVLMPVAALILQKLALGTALPLSWALRTGYWTYAAGRIGEHPWRGWGLDASRAFTPHIQLHPHNGPLQVWLELGVLGAILAALFWAAAFRAQASRARNLLTAACVASGAVYLFFGLISFGTWQEWWLALGALIAVVMAAAPERKAA